MSSHTLDLPDVRQEILAHCDTLLDEGKPYGCYRPGGGKPPDLYSSCDIAILRTIMGEDLTASLSHTHRTEWIAHINSFAEETDGSYSNRSGHSALHANGMVVGALGALGGRQRYPVKLYDAFSTPDKVEPWLEKIDWVYQWGASHWFWGGMHCYSMSQACTPEWLERVFYWLDTNLDPDTGWWRKGSPHADRHQPLGGSVHILPIYEHHGRRFPYPERVIDSVLALQLPNSRWLGNPSQPVHVMSYLELDALYALRYMSSLAPDRRSNEVAKAVDQYSGLVQNYWREHQEDFLALHPHIILAGVGTLGLLQQLKPDRFHDLVQWSDIFSDKRLYQTGKAEALPSAEVLKE